MTKQMLLTGLLVFMVSYPLIPQGISQIEDETTPSLCEEELSQLNDELTLITDMSEGLARQDKFISANYVSERAMEDGDLQKARRRALSSALRYLVRLATKQMVSPTRLTEMNEDVEKKIYRKYRMFIRTFQPSKAEICGDQYRLPVKVVLKAHDLRKALLKYKILEVEFGLKDVRAYNVKGRPDYEWIKKYLRKNLRNVKRIVVKYQKKGEVHFLVETPMSTEEILRRLKDDDQTERSLTFKKGEEEGVELTLTDKDVTG